MTFNAYTIPVCIRSDFHEFWRSTASICNVKKIIFDEEISFRLLPVFKTRGILFQRYALKNNLS